MIQGTLPIIQVPELLCLYNTNTGNLVITDVVMGKMTGSNMKKSFRRYF